MSSKIYPTVDDKYELSTAVAHFNASIVPTTNAPLIPH
jgi:hypothetical protein